MGCAGRGVGSVVAVAVVQLVGGEGDNYLGTFSLLQLIKKIAREEGMTWIF